MKNPEKPTCQNWMFALLVNVITTSLAGCIVIGAHLCSLSQAIFPYAAFCRCSKTFKSNTSDASVCRLWRFKDLVFTNSNEMNLRGANLVPVEIEFLP